MSEKIEIIAFYEFMDMLRLGPLPGLKDSVKQLMQASDVRGTLILADEGYNGMVCGVSESVARFVSGLETLFQTRLRIKSSFHQKAPFRRLDVKIKREVVTLRKTVDVSLGVGTHVGPAEWNSIIGDPETLVLDTRNDYEYKTGTFVRAINPGTSKFSELPAYISENLDPERHTKIAMFCTGGIRCEKFAPYMKQLGFREVYQLEGGILNYLENVSPEESLWEGECFVFDERISVDATLAKGHADDLSQRHDKHRNPLYTLS